MIINKLKIGLITAAISMFAIPVASAQSIRNFKQPVLNKIAAILDIRVDVLKGELRKGESIMEIAKEFDATKSEIKQIKKVLRVARSTPVVVKPVVIVKPVVVVTKPVVVIVKNPVRRPVRRPVVIIVKPVVLAPRVVKKPVVAVKQIANVLDMSTSELKRDLRSGQSVLEIAKDENATRSELRQLKEMKNRGARVVRHNR